MTMVLNIILNAFYLLLLVLLSSLGILVGIKLYKNLDKEDRQEKGKVIQKIIKNHEKQNEMS